jgi:hypothetical protein
MSAVHEEMHQWAGEEQQKWEYPEEMRAVLGPQIERGDDSETD